MNLVEEKNITTASSSLENKELDKTTLMLIEEHVRHVLVFMGFGNVSIKCSMINNEMLQINIEAGDDGKLLIGNKGNHLTALQHIVRCVLRKHMSREVLITVDVNSYRSRRESSLFSLAENVARKAQRTGRTVAMEPMSSVDRRTIHAALANRKDIRTESLGEDPNRRVIVKPVFL